MSLFEVDQKRNL